MIFGHLTFQLEKMNDFGHLTFQLEKMNDFGYLTFQVEKINDVWALDIFSWKNQSFLSI